MANSSQIERKSGWGWRVVLVLAILPLTGCVPSLSSHGAMVRNLSYDGSIVSVTSPFSNASDLLLFPVDTVNDSDGIWGRFPGPSEPSNVEIQSPMPLIPLPEGTINILILGSDTRPGFYGSRTDTVMIISLDTENNKVKMVSIPRDLYVYIPGWKVNRINTADQHGGPGMVAQTILYNLGIEVHYWARVSFNGFISAVDTLGGIDIHVPNTIVDECDEVMVSFPAGSNHMDGYTALCYARVRKASSDFARTQRQQEVIKAVFSKVLSLGGISRVPELYSLFGDLVDSDMELGEVLPLIPLAATVASDRSRIEGYTIDLSMVSNYRTSTGAAVLLPQREVLHDSLVSIFSQ